MSSTKAPRHVRGWFVFYNAVLVPLMFAAFVVAARLSRKIRRGIRGRASLMSDLARQLRAISPQRPRVWIHAASMGEYEQARPIIREIRQRLPECVIILSFFSPSAYEHVQKDASLADVVCYLPFDSRGRALRFLRVVQPDAGIFIRHDLWPNHLWLAKNRGVFLMLASASVHEKSLRHKPLLRSLNRAVFESFDIVGAISNKAVHGLEKFVRDKARLLVTGDTRYDQVLFRSREKKLDGVLPEIWRDGNKTFVAGSIWREDAAVIVPAFAAAQKRPGSLRLIIVPHEPTPAHVQEIEALCASAGLAAVRLSHWRDGNQSSVLIVDRVGILANLYGVGQVAFVGGSFGPGIHNVLEAAVHGVPVLFGPRMRNSAEAIEMVDIGISQVVNDELSCHEVLARLFSDQNHREHLAERSRAFVLERCGASSRLVDLLERALAVSPKAASLESIS
jgi:3-deoxy-D-manno-octulosonic-acid transferase